MLTLTHMTHQVEVERASASATACVYLASGSPQANKFAGRTINLDWRCAP